MDTFETETLNQFAELVDELQLCFLDGDAYSRPPSLQEWKTASRLTHRIKLLIFELRGYVTACSQYKIVSQQEKENPDAGTSGESQGFVEFTDKEIKQMPKHIQGLMIVNRQRCHWRKRKSGNGFSYEVRFRAKGLNLSASGKTKELAKENMKRKLMNAQVPTANDCQTASAPTTFTSFATYYFENFRVAKVTEQTYKIDFRRCQNYLFPRFAETPLSKILPFECKTFLDGIRAEGKGKTADELYCLLSLIFKAAIAHGIVLRNPLDMVVKITHQRESGTALTVGEQERLLAAVRGTVYQHATALAMFTGLRPNELKKFRIEGEFLIAENSKRKTRKTEYKRIYVCKRLRELLPADEKPYICDLNKLRAKIRCVLPNHKLYDLRVTFNTRCKELGVSEHARMHFMGHSLGALGAAYTDLSDEYLLKEGKRLNFW